MPRDGVVVRVPFGPMSPDSASLGTKIHAVEDLVPLPGGKYRELPPLWANGDTFSDGGADFGWPTGRAFDDPSVVHVFGTGSGAANQSRLMEYTSGGGFADRSRPAKYAAGADWRFTRFGPNIAACNGAGVDPVQVQTASGGAFADLFTSTAKPTCHHIGTIRTHVVMAYTSDASGVHPNRVQWTAKDNIADADPGSNKAGWFELPDEAISDMVCFEHFGLLFTEQGVHRFDYIGGDPVFSRQQIAGPRFGTFLATSHAVRGPANSAIFPTRHGRIGVVMDGQQVIELGEGEWSSYFGMAPGTFFYSFEDGSAIAIGRNRSANAPSAAMDGFDGRAYMVSIDGTVALSKALNPAGNTLPFGVFSAVSGGGSDWNPPFGTVYYFARPTAGTLAAYEFDWENQGTSEATMVTGVLEPVSDSKSYARAARLVYRKYAGDGQSTFPQVDYKLEWSNSPDFGSPLDSGWLTHDADEAGWVTFPDQGPGQFWRVWVRVNAHATPWVIREIASIDLLVSRAPGF